MIRGIGVVELQVQAISDAMWDEIVRSKNRPGICELEDAEDVAQDTMLCIWRLIERGSRVGEVLMEDPASGKVRAAVFTIARHIEGNRRKREALRCHESNTDGYGRDRPSVSLVPAPVLGPEDEAVLSDMREWALGCLSPRQAEVMELTLIGHTSSEIAGDLGIGARTVRFARAVGRKKILAAIKTEEE